MRFYEKSADAIFRYCYFRVYDREVAKELTQEAFTRAWQYIADSKPVDNLNALVYQISRNLIYDYREKNKKIADSQDIAELQIADNKNLQEQTIISLESQHLINNIDKLEPEFKEVIVLRFMHGLKPREIAKILNLSSNIISVRINRAKRKLQEGHENTSK